MSLLRKIFSDKAAPGGNTTQFRDSEPEDEAPDGAPRRELVHVVLRDTMRRHGIPSDWIDCRVLSVVGTGKLPVMHVTFIVRGGQERLLAYVPAFQASYWAEIARFEPRVRDWLLSLSWQFDGLAPAHAAAMPDPASWSAAPATASTPAASTEDDVEQDLKALFAIRDAALRDGGEHKDEGSPDFQPTRPML